MLGGSPFGIHSQGKGSCRSCQIARPHLQPHVSFVIAVKINPCRFQRLVTFGNDRYLRALDATHISLPLDRFVFALRVVGIVVSHLTHEQRWGIDNGDSYRQAVSIARLNGDLDRLVESACLIGKQSCEACSSANLCSAWLHCNLPLCCSGCGCRRVFGGCWVGEWCDRDDRLFVAVQAANNRCHKQLPSPHKRCHPRICFQPSAIGFCILAAIGCRCFSRQPPGENRRVDANPRRWRKANPRQQQTRGAHEQTLGSRHLVDARQPHQQRQAVGQSHSSRTIHDNVVGYGRESLGGAML